VKQPWHSERLASALAAVLSLFWMFLYVAAAQQPSPVAPSTSNQLPPSAELRGIVSDAAGAPLAGAHITLLDQSSATTQQSTTQPDGAFDFQDLPPGSFTVEATLQGFAPLSKVVTVADTANQPLMITMSKVNISVEVIATEEDIATAQIQLQEQQRFLFIFPNFFVSYNWNAVPLTPRQKFSLAFHDVIDPGNLLLVGTVAAIQQATDSFNGYGQGAAGYGRRYGADLGNLVSGTMVSEAVLPSLLHQDPRYFYKGTGTASSRLGYALASVVTCRGDNGHTQFAVSRLLGDMSAGAISNLYYAPSDRKGAGLTLVNGLLGIAGDAMNNVFQEFLLHKLTRHTDLGSAPKPH
jgi:hypothetical protein